MGSMDFAYDLLDKIQEENTDYLLVTLRKGRQQYKIDVFYVLENEESDAALLTVLDEVARSVQDGQQRPPPEDREGEDSFGDDDDEDYDDGYYESGDEEDLI